MSYLERIAQEASKQTLSQEEMAYYARHLLLPWIGVAGQRKLKASRVLVVGAGGLGCSVLQALSGAGVGQITVLDGDRVEHSNLSRQWLHSMNDIGINKAVSAVAELHYLNPFIRCVAESVHLTPDNAVSSIGAHDIVIDATDDLDVRYLIDDTCADLGKPWIHAALYREHAQIAVFWARYGSTFRQLYPQPTEAPSCSGAGMLGATVSALANLQALECIHILVGHENFRIGQLYLLDTASYSLRPFQLPGVRQPPLHGQREEPISSHGVSPEQLSQALSIHEPILLLDLRDTESFSAGCLPGACHYPAHKLLEAPFPDMKQPRAILYCEEGTVSSLLVEALHDRIPVKIQHLEGGYAAWSDA